MYRSRFQQRYGIRIDLSRFVGLVRNSKGDFFLRYINFMVKKV